jgi:hypothetical protein
MARAKALARMADPHAPPPTMLAHAVHKQRRAVAGSKWLYETISKIATLVGVELVVLPGGVKKLPRTVFKCGVNYNCDLSEITDQVRCTVGCESLAQVAAMLRALLASADVSVVRVKNRFAPDYDATPAGGYLDLQTIVAFECGSDAGEWMLGEVQVNLWSMLRIKEAPGGGHKVFNFARSLRAYDEATYVYDGKLDAGWLRGSLRGRCWMCVWLTVVARRKSSRWNCAGLFRRASVGSQRWCSGATRSETLVQWRWPTRSRPTLPLSQ